jgi:hypothetical protein
MEYFVDMKLTKRAARLSIVCILAHGLIFGLLHFLEPQLSPSRSIISDYFHTASAWLATLAILFFAIGWASLGVALVEVPKSRIILAGRILFVLAFISIIVGVVFPTSMDPRTGSLLSKIQNLLARPGLFMGVLLISLGLLGKPGWKAQARILLTLSITVSILLVMTIKILLPIELGGIGQRLIFLLLYVWIWLTATHTIKLTDSHDISLNKE